MKLKNFEPHWRKLIESFRCHNGDCRALPGLDQKSKERYPCEKNAHLLCKNCMDGPGRGWCYGSEGECSCYIQRDAAPSTFVLKALEGMPCFCPNYDEGCPEVFTEIEEFTKHKFSCKFSSMQCVVCDEYASFKDYLKHINGHKAKKPLRVQPNQFRVLVDPEIAHRKKEGKGWNVQYDTIWGPYLLKDVENFNFIFVVKEVDMREWSQRVGCADRYEEHLVKVYCHLRIIGSVLDAKKFTWKLSYKEYSYMKEKKELTGKVISYQR